MTPILIVSLIPALCAVVLFCHCFIFLNSSFWVLCTLWFFLATVLIKLKPSNASSISETAHYASGPMWGVQFGLGRSWQDSRFTLWHPYRYMNLQKKIWEVEICRSWCFAGSKVFLLNGLSQCFAGFMVLLLSRLTERIELGRHSVPVLEELQNKTTCITNAIRNLLTPKQIAFLRSSL